MFPNERKMQKYDLSEEDLDNIVEFFKWIGEIDLNGFPVEPNLKPATTVVNAPTSTAVQPEKFKTLCVACHAVAGVGGNIGPALDGVADRYELDYLTRWISDPPSVKPGTQMPKLPLTDGEINELVTYLTTLK